MPDPVNTPKFKITADEIEALSPKKPEAESKLGITEEEIKTVSEQKKDISALEYQGAKLQEWLIPSLGAFLQTASENITGGVIPAIIGGKEGRQYAKMQLDEIIPEWREAREENNLLIQEYDPSLVEDVVAMVIGMAVDAPSFMVPAAGGARLTKGLLKASGLIKKAGVKGAEVAVEKGLRVIGNELAERSISNATAFATHTFVNNTVKDLGEGKSLEQIDWKYNAKEGAKSGFLGATVGGLGYGMGEAGRFTAQALKNTGYATRLLADKGIKLVGLGTEAGIFTAGGQLVSGEDIGDSWSWRDYWLNVGGFGASKAMHGLKSGKAFQDPLLQVNSRYDIVKNFREMNVTEEELSTLGLKNRAELEERMFDKEYMLKLSKDKDVPATLKTKLNESYAPTGRTELLPDLIKSAEKTNAFEKDGNIYVETRDADGNRLEFKKVEDWEEANKAKVDIEDFIDLRKDKDAINQIRNMSKSESTSLNRINAELASNEIAEDLDSYFRSELTNTPRSKRTPEQLDKNIKARKIINDELEKVRDDIAEDIKKQEEISKKLLQTEEKELKRVTSEIDKIKSVPETEKISEADRKKLTELESERSVLEANVKIRREQSLQKLKTEEEAQRKKTGTSGLQMSMPAGEKITDEEYDNFKTKDYVGEGRLNRIEDKLKNGEELSPRETEIASKKLPEAFAKASAPKPADVPAEGKIPPVKLSAKTGSQIVPKRGLGKRVFAGRPTADERAQGFEKRITIIDDDTKSVRTYLTKKGFDTEFKAKEKQYSSSKGGDTYMTPKQAADYNKAVDTMHKQKPYEEIEVPEKKPFVEKTPAAPKPKASSTKNKPVVDFKKNDIVNLGGEKTYTVDKIEGDNITLTNLEDGSIRQVHRSKIKGIGEKAETIPEEKGTKPTEPKPTPTPKSEPKPKPEKPTAAKPVEKPVVQPKKESDAKKTGTITPPSGKTKGTKGGESGSLRVRNAEKKRVEAEQREKERLVKLVNDISDLTRTNREHVRKTFETFRNIWGMSEDKAAASAVIYDILAETLAIRSGTTKDEVIKSIRHSKDVEEFNKYMKKKAKVMFQLIPEITPTISQNMGSLILAKNMETAGMTVAQIYKKTGWTKVEIPGRDPMWMLETEAPHFYDPRVLESYDKLAESKNLYGNFKIPITNILLPTDPMFKYLPDVRDIIVEFDPKLSGEAAWHEETKTLTIKGSKPSDLLKSVDKKGSFVHELQHFVQGALGLPRGGDQRDVHKLIDPSSLTSSNKAEIIKELVHSYDITPSDAIKSLESFLVYWDTFKEYTITTDLVLKAKTELTNHILNNTASLIRNWNKEIDLLNKKIKDANAEGKDTQQLTKYLEGIIVKRAESIKMIRDGNKLADLIEGEFKKQNPDLKDRQEKALDRLYGSGEIAKKGDNDQVRYAIYRTLWGEANARDAQFRALVDMGKFGKRTGNEDLLYSNYGKAVINPDASFTHYLNTIAVKDPYFKQYYQSKKGGKLSNGLRRAAVIMFGDGRNIMYALSSPIPTSPLHEMVHIWEKYLLPSERQIVLDWAKEHTKETEWSDKTSEMFADGFEKFLMDGKAPEKRLETVFSKFRDWLMQIYNSVSGVTELPLNEKMFDLYSKMLSPESVLRETREIENSIKIEDGHFVFQKDLTSAAVEQKIKNLLDEKQKLLDEDLRKFNDELRKVDEEGSSIEVEVDGEKKMFRVRLINGDYKVSSMWDRTTATINGREVEKMTPVRDKELKQRIIDQFKAETDPVIEEKRKLFIDEMTDKYINDIKTDIKRYILQRNMVNPEAPKEFSTEEPIAPTKPSEGKARKEPLPSAGDKETVDVAKALKDEIRMMAKTALEVKKTTDKEFDRVASEIRKKILHARDNKHISRGQYLSLIGRLGSANTKKRIMSLIDNHYTVYNPMDLDKRGHRKPVADYLVSKIVDEYERIRNILETDNKNNITDPIELAKKNRELDKVEIPIVYKGVMYNVNRQSSYLDKVLDSSYWKGLNIDAKKIVGEVTDNSKITKSKYGNATEMAQQLKDIELKDFTIEELEEFVSEGNRILKNSKTPSIAPLEYLVSKYGDRIKEKKEHAGIKSYDELIDYIEGKTDEESGEIIKPGVRQVIEELLSRDSEDVSSREFMNAIRKLSMAKHKAWDLQEQGVLSDIQVDYIENLIGTFSTKISPKEGLYGGLMSHIKSSYIDNILRLRVAPETQAGVNNNFDPLLRDLIKDFLSVDQAYINKLDFATIEAYNESVLNLQRGYVTPSLNVVRNGLRAIELHEAYMKKAVNNVFTSRAWDSLLKNGFMTAKEKKIWDMQAAVKRRFWGDPKIVESARLMQLFNAWKSHRLDTLFGNFDKYARLGAIYEINGRSMIQADKLRSRFDDIFYKTYREFEKVNKFAPVRNRKLALIGLVMSEQRLQASPQYQDMIDNMKISEETASISDYDYRLKPKQQLRWVGILSSFARNQDVWMELRDKLINENAYRMVTGENGKEVMILDMKRAEELIREDTGIANMIDMTRQVLAELSPYAEIATMDNNRSYIASPLYYPFYTYSRRSELRNEDVINLINRGYSDVMTQASSTRAIQYKQKLIDLSPASVIPKYINEISRNYYLRPELMASRRAIKMAIDEFTRENTEKSGAEFERKFVPQMLDTMNEDLMNRIRFQYKAGRYAEHMSVIGKYWNRALKASKKFALANLIRIAPEYSSNVMRAYLSTHDGLLESNKILAFDNNVYTEIITDYIGSRYFSQYSSEWGEKFSRSKTKGKLESGLDWIITFSDTSVGRPLFVNEFRKAFRDITGRDFDQNEFAAGDRYKIDNRLAVEKSALAALRKVEELFNDKNPLTGSVKTRFFGGLIIAPNNNALTQIFDYLQSFNRNEMDQLWDSARRRKFSDNIEDRIQGKRDVYAVLSSNVLYNIFRSFLTVSTQHFIFNRDDEFYDKKWEEFISNFGWLRKSGTTLVTTGIGGNANILKIPLQWTLFNARDIESIDDEKLAALEEYLDRDIYLRRIAKGGTAEQILTAVLPFPTDMTKDYFRLQEDAVALINGMLDLDFTDEEAVKTLDLFFRSLKYIVPNPLNLPATRITEKEIRKIKEDAKMQKEIAKKSKKDPNWWKK